MITQRGAMAWMTPNIKQETISGSLGRAFSRLMTGESFFQNVYTAMDAPGTITFSSRSPGKIIPVKISTERSMVVQQSAFLASEERVRLSIYFQKRLGAGLFGGEGFIMQRLSGDGMAFVEIDGYAQAYELAAGQSMIVDTGKLAMMDDTCTMDIRAVKGARNLLFSGDGVFHTVVTGPGMAVFQSMTIQEMADLLSASIVQNPKK